MEELLRLSFRIGNEVTSCEKALVVSGALVMDGPNYWTGIIELQTVSIQINKMKYIFFSIQRVSN